MKQPIEKVMESSPLGCDFVTSLFMVYVNEPLHEDVRLRGGQVPKISLRNVCHKSPVFWEKNWESCVTNSRFFQDPKLRN